MRLKSFGQWVLAAGMVLGVTGVQSTPAQAQFQKKHLYEDDANPRADIAAGVKQARAEHKRVLVDFGGNWCGDCQVLDIYFHQPENDTLLSKNFVVVHVSVGPTGIDKNFDLAASYGVPLGKGVPALVVLDANGKAIYSQKTGEFENMRNMQSQSVHDFLEKWKAS